MNRITFNLKLCLSFLFFLFFSIFLVSQDNAKKPSIYIDCQMRCDFTFIKQEVTFVDYIFNRDEADIYILATRQRTGAGGNEIQLVFQGNKDYASISDTLIYVTDPNATDAIEREQFVKNLKKGLLPFIIISPLADNMTYDVKTLSADEVAETTKDPWNYWVFNIGGNASLDGEASFSGSQFQGRLTTSRVTNKSKFYYSFRYNYERSKFTLTDGEEFSSIIKRFSNFVTYVHSLNDKWSVGFRADAGSSTFGNTDFDASFKPAIEYNIFPYSEASTRRFSFLYSIGPEYKDYTDITIYDKLEQTVVQQNLSIEFEQIQKWGSVEVDLRANQFLHDYTLWSMVLNPNVEWAIYKGLRLDMGGYISLVSDRINIAKSEITDEDILLQIKQLDTNFTYFTYIGINFRFGSKINNFVNPRF